MVKQISTIFLLLAFSLQFLNRVVVYVDYYANTAVYAANCENKAIPIMHCNGKCQMVKKLKAQEKKESQLPQRKILNEDFTKLTMFSGSPDTAFFEMLSSYTETPFQHTVARARSHFHPPGSYFI